MREEVLARIIASAQAMGEQELAVQKPAADAHDAAHDASHEQEKEREAAFEQLLDEFTPAFDRHTRAAMSGDAEAFSAAAAELSVIQTRLEKFNDHPEFSQIMADLEYAVSYNQDIFDQRAVVRAAEPTGPEAGAERDLAAADAHDKAHDTSHEQEKERDLTAADRGPAATGPVLEAEGTAEERYAEAKARYEKAKKDHESVRGVKDYIKTLTSDKHRTTRTTIIDEFDKATKELEIAKTEFALANAEGYVDSVLKDSEKEFKAVFGNKSGFRKLWDKMGEKNIYAAGWEKKGKKVDNWLARTGLRLVSARTVISGSLLLGSVFTGGATGLGFLIARRAMGGAGGAIGASEIYKKFAIGRQEKLLDEKLARLAALENEGKDVSEKELGEALAAFEVTRSLSGKNPAEDETYKKLLVLEQKKFAQWVEAAREGGTITREEITEKFSDRAEERKRKAAKEIGKRKRRTLYAGAVGGALGAGAIQEGLKWWRGAGQVPTGANQTFTEGGRGSGPGVPHPPDAPSGRGPGMASETKPPGTAAGTETIPPRGSVPPTAQSVESLSAKPISAGLTEAPKPPAESGAVAEAMKLKLRAGAVFERHGGVGVLRAGGRGIEGALLDLKDANPEAYAKMIAKLHEQYPDFKGNDGSLIHKWTEAFAKAHDYKIGKGMADLSQGEHDLSRIRAASIEINLEDGSLSEAKNVDFIEPQETPTPAGKTVPVDENLRKMIKEAFSQEPRDKKFTIDFDHQAPSGQAGAEAAGSSDMSSMPEAVSTLEAKQIADARLYGAWDNAERGHLSEALDLVTYGKKSKFLKEMGIKLSDLKKIQELDLQNFLDRHESGKFGKPFDKFAKFAAKLISSNNGFSRVKVYEAVLSKGAEIFKP